MRRLCWLAIAATTVSGAAHAQVVARPLPAPVPIAPGIVPARPAVEYAGPTAFQKAMQSHAVVAGTVSLGKETVDAPQWPGTPTKTTFRVATIKVTDTLVGAKAETVKVLLPPGDPTYVNDRFPGQPVQPYYPQFPNQIQLIDGQEGVFFLQRHPTVADAFLHAGGSPPLNPLDSKYKSDLAEVQAVSAVHADPIKALKAEKADDRMKAASVLVSKYRRQPNSVGKPQEQTAIPAEESKLILKALMESDWTVWDNPPPGVQMDWNLNPTHLLSLLQIHTGAPGKGNFPQVRQQPGQGYHAAYKEAFKTWSEGDGKDFEIKRYVVPGEKKAEPKK